MALADLWRDEVRQKKRLMRQANPGRTPRPSPGNLNRGIREDYREKRKITERMVQD